MLYGYAHVGYGVHVWELSEPDLNSYTKTVIAASIIYIPCLAFGKIAMLILFYNLLHMLWIWKYIIISIGCIIFSYSIGLVIPLIFACTPIAKNWDIRITTGTCINRTGLYLATAVTNTASDVILILIPIKFVWGLHLPAMQKLGIILLFTMGGLTIVISIVRLATLVPLVASSDQPYEMALECLLISIEANLIILCGCLIFLRQFLRFHAPRLMGDRSSTHRSSEGSSQFGQLAVSPDISWSRKRRSSFSQWYHREEVLANTSDDRPEMGAQYGETRLHDAV
jgi:hypothetical protein